MKSIPAESILRASHQVWKLYVMTLGVVISVGLMVFAEIHKSGIAPGSFILIVVAASGIAFGSLMVAFLYIRCPVCGMRWLWCAATTHRSNKWMNWLVKLNACPSCGYGQSVT